MIEATCIGFSRQGAEMPTPAEMTRTYHQLESIFRQLGAKPTYFSAYDGGIGRGQFKKWDGPFHRKVLESGMSGYCSVTLAANPTGSKEPGYDSFVTAHFGFSPGIETVNLQVVVNEPYMNCESAECESIIDKLAQLWTWDYGFGFSRDAERAPDAYLAGGGSDLQSDEDERRVALWYESSHDFYKGVEPPRRFVMVRDIFPYNMIGPEHLTHRLSDGRSLRAFIEADPDSELRPLTASLWLWKVPQDRTETVREKLLGKGVIIAE